MRDRDLAGPYGVTTGNLNLAVRRNRFPDDFIFQLTREETDSLPLRFVRANRRGGRRARPCAFTEQRVAMLSSVLRSHRAALVNIAIMRAFVRIQEVLPTHNDLAQKLEALETKYIRHDAEIERRDADIQEVFEAIRQLIEQPVPPQRQIGFQAERQKDASRVILFPSSVKESEALLL